MRFTKDHEWVELAGDVATVGITAYAAQQLGDVVFVELPAVGKVLGSGEPMAVVESVKAASDVYSPIAGEVVAVNEITSDEPDRVNAQPESGGWLAKIKVADTAAIDAFMDRDGYEAFLSTL